MIKYNIEHLVGKDPKMIPGIEDVMFSASVNFDMVAVKQSNNDVSTSLDRTQGTSPRESENALYVYK